MSLYQTWEDLAADDRRREDAGISASDRAASGNTKIAFSAASLRELGAPQELIALFEEKERLEKQLHLFTGDTEPDPDDERRKRCFPVKVHTKESRIEERRLRLHDERLAMIKKRQQAKAALETKKTARALQAMREANNRKIISRRNEKAEQEFRKKTLEAAILARKSAVKREEIREQNRSKAACEKRLLLLQNRRESERLEELVRRNRERHVLENRWRRQRQHALAEYAQAIKQNQIVEQQRQEQIVRSAVVRMVQKRQEAARLEQEENDRRTRLRVLAANVRIRKQTQARAFERARERSRDRARDDLRRKCAHDAMVKRRLDKRSVRER